MKSASVGVGAAWLVAAAAVHAQAGNCDAVVASIESRIRANGAIRLLTAAEILSVKANAHYSTVFDGHVDHFCNLSITEIEERLDPGRFVRVHRSFLVNRDHVAAFRRHGDQGLLELDCTPPFQVPDTKAALELVQSSPNAIAYVSRAAVTDGVRVVYELKP